MLNLELRSPLIFEKADNSPEELREMNQSFNINNEFLLCYEINSRESRSIEPDREHYLMNLESIGRKSSSPFENNSEKTSLPAGKYLFSQIRGVSPLGREEWLDMAIEQQKDGLWERYKPGNLLYIRFLYEEGKYVTQVFRSL